MELSTIIGKKGMERTATLHSASDFFFKDLSVQFLLSRSHILHKCPVDTRGGDDLVPVCGKAEPKRDDTQERVATFLPPLQIRRNHLGRATPIFLSILIPLVFEDRTRQKFLSSTGTVLFPGRRW